MPQEITPAEHLEYLVSSVRLIFWFVWRWMDEHPQETFADTIQNRTDIWARTSFNPSYLDPRCNKVYSTQWHDLIKALESVYSYNRKSGTAQTFEDDAIALVMPYLSARVERDLVCIRNKVDVEHYQCGSLRYDIKPNPDTPKRVGIHIANACYPASPFDDPLYFPRCFMDLLDQVEKKLQVTEFACGSWMNSYPRWLRFFPREWLDNMSPPNSNVWGHYGFWGQFMTSRKTFNHKLANQFRETGRFPYPLRYSFCTIAAMKNHLGSLAVKSN
jgi:hypothetical protein